MSGTWSTLSHCKKNSRSFQRARGSLAMPFSLADNLFARGELTSCGRIKQRLIRQRIPETERESRRHVITVRASIANLTVKEPR